MIGQDDRVIACQDDRTRTLVISPSASFSLPYATTKPGHLDCHVVLAKDNR
jgi:hypothetical protein